LEHPCKFQLVSRLGSVTARHPSIGRQPNFTALNRAAITLGIGPHSCSFYLSSFSFFFLDYAQPSHIGCLPYFHTCCGLSANLECRSEICCTRLAEIQDAKRQKCAICVLSHNFVGPYIRNQGHMDKLLNSNVSSTCPHNMADFDPLTAEIGSVVWGTPANFNGFRVLPSLLQRRRSPEANQILHDVWPPPGLVN